MESFIWILNFFMTDVLQIDSTIATRSDSYILATNGCVYIWQIRISHAFKMHITSLKNWWKKPADSVQNLSHDFPSMYWPFFWLTFPTMKCLIGRLLKWRNALGSRMLGMRSPYTVHLFWHNFDKILKSGGPHWVDSVDSRFLQHWSDTTVRRQTQK